MLHMDEDQWMQVQQKFRQVREQVAIRQREQQRHRQYIEQLRVEQQQRDTGALYALPPKPTPSGRLQESINKVDRLARQAELRPTESHYDLWRQQVWLESKRRLQEGIMQRDPEGWLPRKLSHLLATAAPPPIEERQTERIPTVKNTQRPTTQPLRQPNHQRDHQSA
jgi:hypothetical protein